MDTTYLIMNMRSVNFSSICKVRTLVCGFLQNVVFCVFVHCLRSSLTLSYCSGEAESGLERLHQCVEKDLVQFLNAEVPSKDFNDFRTKLAGLTR